MCYDQLILEWNQREKVSRGIRWNIHELFILCHYMKSLQYCLSGFITFITSRTMVELWISIRKHLSATKQPKVSPTHQFQLEPILCSKVVLTFSWKSHLQLFWIKMQCAKYWYFVSTRTFRLKIYWDNQVSSVPVERSADRTKELQGAQIRSKLRLIEVLKVRSLRSPRLPNRPSPSEFTSAGTDHRHLLREIAPELK